MSQKEEIQYRDPYTLKINPENIRTFDPDEEDNVKLRKSLLTQGVLNPLHIYEDGTVADGNSRLNNLLHAFNNGEQPFDVRVIVIDRPESEAEAILRQLNVNQARQLPIHDQATAFSKLHEVGYNNKQIADLTPFTPMHVGNVMVYASASSEIKEQVRSGYISATLVIETLRAYGKERGEELIAEAFEIAKTVGKSKVTQQLVDAALAKISIKDSLKESGKDSLKESKTLQQPSPSNNNVEEAENGNGNASEPDTGVGELQKDEGTVRAVRSELCGDDEHPIGPTATLCGDERNSTPDSSVQPWNGHDEHLQDTMCPVRSGEREELDSTYGDSDVVIEDEDGRFHCDGQGNQLNAEGNRDVPAGNRGEGVTSNKSSPTTKESSKTGPTVKQLAELLNDFFAPAEQFIAAADGDDADVFCDQAFAFVETLKEMRETLTKLGVLR